MKITKYFIILFILFILFMILSSCQSNNKVSNIPSEKKFGVSISSMEEEVFPIMKEAMLDNQKRDNTKIIWLNANKDEKKQKADINSLLEENVDIIIINPVDSKKAAELVETIHKKEIPVLALDRIVENAKLEGYITADNFKVGREQAVYLSEQIDHKGKIILLKGDKKNNVAYEITAGNKEFFKKNTKIDIIVEKWHKNWSAELAEKTVREALKQHPGIKGILANNSNMAMAAVKVLKEKKLTKEIVTVGADANKEACIAIAKGEHNADVDKMPYLQGLLAFKSSLMITNKEKWLYDRIIKNGDYKVPVKVSPVMLIDKYNLITLEDRWPELKNYIYDK